MSTEASRDLVLGTAGHIDHGKSSLVRALTGTDPDRLIEEKKRGITIELGFARLELPGGDALGVVDVPGHERFVRQMIAGATGIDLALICIAADDGIMPQTVEHLSVLELLGISAGVIALTKADLVDEEWLIFMADEVRARLADSPFSDAPIVAVSSRTGRGLEELTEALERTARAAQHTKTGGTARLPIDRAFTIKGAGTVVTGTLWAGSFAVGDEVELLPSGLRTRIRSMQVHGESVERAVAGHRTALNLNAVSTDEVRPGDFVALPNSLSPTDRFDADITYLGAPGAAKPLESGTRVRIAHGTREVTGRVLFFGDADSLASGNRAFAQVRLDEALPVAWRDRFVMRSFSPVHVIGGGMVLRAHPRRTTALKPDTEALLDALRAQDEGAVVRAAFALETLPQTSADIAHRSGVDEETARAELDALVREGKAVRLEGRAAFYTTKPALQRHRAALENALMKFHTENPSATGIAKDALRQRTMPRAGEEAFDAVLADAVVAGAAIATGGEVSHPRAGAGAQKALEAAVDNLKASLADAGTAPPSVSDLVAASGVDPSLAHRALGELEKRGFAKRIGQEFSFDASALAHLEAAARERLEAGPATAADLKEAMGTSRKYAIPLLEYFDARGMTRREGDLRYLR
ncbi:selenocysteine-specific translation elongation factor [Raoultibacter phocaeensis]|uniref:selenocysteine-specific translation elongation factor n=1 Tax=Raoultibacter phocaeensis TaxID=2479841 RepID=UPI00111A72F0|nr:selenocysteine-specific translation elongation factor [Raoultibacter phocaeensis]